MAEPQIDVMDEGGPDSIGTKYAVNRQTGQVMRNDGSGWAKVQSAKNAQGEILINEGGSWVPVPAGGAQARQKMTRGEVIPLMAREGLEWGLSDEGAGVMAMTGLPKWATDLYGNSPLGMFQKMGAATGTIAAEAMGAKLPQAYTEARDAKRAEINQARQDHPVTSTVSEIAGGVAYPGGAMKGGAPLVKQVPRMAALGAAQGGAYGFNTAEGDVSNRVEDAKTGAAFGAALGGALPVGVAGARVPVRTVKNAGASLYDGFMGLFGREGGARMSAAEQTALAAVRRSMERSQMTPEQIAQAVAEFGDKPAVLAEVIGQDAVDALTAITRKPGSTSQKAQAIIEDRYEGFPGRAQDDLESATGVELGQAPEQFRQLVEQQQQAARPLYDQLSRDFADINSERLDELSKASTIKPLASTKKPKDVPQASPDLPDDLSPELEAWARSLLDEPEASGLLPLSGAAVQEARDLAIAQGRDPKSVSRMDVYDLVKRKLDDKINTAQKNENHTDLNRYTQLRDALVDELDSLTDGQYKAAREAGMGPRLRAAHTRGDRILNSNVRSADVAQTAASSPQEAKALQLGAVDMLSTKIDNNTTPNRLARVPANAQKITTALGEDAGGQFVRKMEAEAKLRDTGRRWGPRMSSVTGTVAERPSSELMEDGARIGFHVLRGNIREAIISAASMMRRRGYNQREIDAMGDLLLSNPMEGLRRLGVRLPSGGNGGAPGFALATGSQPSVGQAPQQAGTNALAQRTRQSIAMLPSVGGPNVGMVTGGISGAAFPLPIDENDTQAERFSKRAGLILAGALAGRYSGRQRARAADDLSKVHVFGDAPPAGALPKTQAGTSGLRPETAQQKDAIMGLLHMPQQQRAIFNTIEQQSGKIADKDVPAVIEMIETAAARGEAPEAIVRSGVDMMKSRGSSGMGFVGGGDAANALAGGAVGGFAPADSTEDRLRNVAIGAGLAAGGGRILPNRAGAASAGVGGKPPKIKPDVPTGTPRQAGQSRIGRTIQQGYDEASGMGAARAIGDPQVVRQQAFREAGDLYMKRNARPAEVHRQTGYLPIEHQGRTIMVYAPDTKPDDVMKAFYTALADPAKATPAQMRLLETAGVLPEPLTLGGPEAPQMLGQRHTPMIEGTGRNALAGQ